MPGEGVLGEVPGGSDAALEDIEMQLLLEGIYDHYGFDFREYAPSSLKRRLRKRVQAEKLQTLSGLQEKVLHDPACMERLLRVLSVNVTAMFRDPGFYAAFRAAVVPLLRTYPVIRIWIAGCSTGEEAYSVAIVLEEEGLYERTRIYATDINEVVLERAKAGALSLKDMPVYTDSYLRAGGTRELSNYFAEAGGKLRISPSLSENIVFAQHNLVSDGPFNEFNVIMCRNVLIYFVRTLQERVHQLFYASLNSFGVLALGQKESLRFTPYEACYQELDARQKLYRRTA